MAAVISELSALSILRVLCGAFFVPHVVGKLSQRQAAIGFFTAAGFRPAAPFAYGAMALEIVLAICLIAGILVVPVAWIACVYLLIAAAAVVKVERKWLWHIGGCEYPVFWAICCGIVAASHHG